MKHSASLFISLVFLPKNMVHLGAPEYKEASEYEGALVSDKMVSTMAPKIFLQ